MSDDQCPENKYSPDDKHTYDLVLDNNPFETQDQQ